MTASSNTKTVRGRPWGKARLGLLATVLVTLLAVTPAALAAAGHRLAARGTLIRAGAAPAHRRLSLVLPLRANIAGLERFATAVTTVGSPVYGQYESIPELARRFGASSAVRSRVVSFLHRAGATGVKIDRTGLFADASMPVSLAQTVFGTSLARYQSGRAGRSTNYIAPTASARIPAGLSGAVSGVVGLNTRPLFGGATATAPAGGRFSHAAGVSTDNQFSGYSERSGSPSGCAGAQAQHGFTPNQYLTAFDYSPLQAQGINGTGERVALIEIDGYRYSDIRAFAGCFGLPVPAVNGYGVNLTRPLGPGAESTLDLEVLIAAAPGLRSVDVYEARARAADALRALTAPLQNAGKVPDVISASLGTCESELEISIGSAGVRSVEGALALAAASGISVLASSGDSGSSGCMSRSGPIPALAVSYPASSPWVTGVGGTNVTLNAANQITSQIVWNDAPYNLSATGGGSSQLFTRPGYQKGFQTAAGRGVPDVSMLADPLPGYDIYCTAAECAHLNVGQWITIGGTSAAAPLTAGGFALVDQLLRENHRQSLGGANSLLYHVAARDPAAGVFSDLSGSDNDLGPYLSTHRPLGCCSAHAGYDLATGLGSLDLGKLALVAAATQPRIASVGVSLPGQRPLAHRRLLAKLSSTGRGLVLAEAQISVAGGRGFTVRSRRHLFAHRGRYQATIGLSRRQVGALRGDLRRHRRVTARVVAVLVDAGGLVERTSRPHSMRISH